MKLANTIKLTKHPKNPYDTFHQYNVQYIYLTNPHKNIQELVDTKIIKNQSTSSKIIPQKTNIKQEIINKKTHTYIPGLGTSSYHFTTSSTFHFSPFRLPRATRTRTQSSGSSAWRSKMVWRTSWLRRTWGPAGRSEMVGLRVLCGRF